MTRVGAAAGGQLKRWVFWPAAGIVLAFVIFALVNPSLAEVAFVSLQTNIVRDFSWFSVLVAAGFVGFVIFIGFSSFGRITLGRDADEPEFTNLSWFSLALRRRHGNRSRLLRRFGAAQPLR